MERVLEVPEEVLEVVEIVRVTRLTREQSVTEEAVVCFNSASIRDTIFSYGLSLAGKSAQMGMVRSTDWAEGGGERIGRYCLED